MGCIKFYGFDEDSEKWILIGETDLRIDVDHYVRTYKYKKFRYYHYDKLIFSVQKEI